MGSACLYFELAPKKAILSDINSDLTETFNTLKTDINNLWDQLSSISHDKDTYYLVRAKDPKTLSTTERSARFIYLNRLCFNGLYRTNKRGQFNVPYGANRAGRFPTLDELKAVATALESADIVQLDFRQALLKARAGDIYYIDPPYAVKNKRVFKQYGPDVFGINDLVDLSILLKEIDRSGAFFVMSYAECDEAKKLLSEWDMKTISTFRNIAGFAKNRRQDNEIIYTNLRTRE